MVAAFAALSVVAYALAGRRWREHRGEWHRIVVRHGVRAARDRHYQAPGDETAPLGDNAYRSAIGWSAAIHGSHSTFLDQASTKYYDVAGPPSPLRQAENSQLGMCR